MTSKRGAEIAPRLLSREQVADYLQCSAATVDKFVEEGLIPEPRPWRGLVRWDKVSLDHVIDRVYGLASNSADQIAIEEAINGRHTQDKVRRDPSKPGRL